MIDKKVYSEVYAVLVALGVGYIDRIPNDFLEFLRNQQDLSYKPEIDDNKALNEQNISKETLAMIAMLELEYWCNSDEEKAELLQLLGKNEQKLREVLESATCTRDLLRMLRKNK